MAASTSGPALRTADIAGIGGSGPRERPQALHRFLGDADHPILLATFLKRRQREYYAALLEVQIKLQWTPWIELFLECAVASCRHTVHLLRELGKISGRWQEHLRARRTRKHAVVWRLADLLLGQPVVTVGALVEHLQVSFPSAEEGGHSAEDISGCGHLEDCRQAALDILRARCPRRHADAHRGLTLPDGAAAPTRALVLDSSDHLAGAFSTPERDQDLIEHDVIEH